ncbi:MAG: baseplate J/gp47 family protein [Butyricicoccus sp.]|nr:baseplate J/gp47 family protein [Butyricicoccus sp.]
MPEFSDLKNLPDISFIDNKTVQEIRDELIADFEEYMSAATGKAYTLHRAHERRMELYAAALQIFQGMQYIDRVGKMQLLKYSEGEWLDNLSILKGVKRLEASAARTTIRFTLSAIRSSATAIPAGTRVATDNMVYFATMEYCEIPAGELELDVIAVALEAGAESNGILVGELCRLVDPIPYVDSVYNITTTSGGADTEDDASLAERNYLAPGAYSTAGPEDSYIYHCKSYSSAIGDIKIASDQQAGTVDVYFLMDDGSDPSPEMIQGLLEYLRTGNFRPMDDLVSASAPMKVEYSIEFTYWINKSSSARAITIQTAVQRAVDQYVAWQRKIGRDINPDELTTVVKMAGAKRLAIASPAFTHVGANKVPALVGTPVISYGGLEDD